MENCFLEALTQAVEQHLLSQAEHKEKEVLKLQAAMTLLSQQSSERLQAQVSLSLPTACSKPRVPCCEDLKLQSHHKASAGSACSQACYVTLHNPRCLQL